MFGCTETGINKHTVEEKYIYPSYYDVYVEDSGIVMQDAADEEQFPGRFGKVSRCVERNCVHTR